MFIGNFIRKRLTYSNNNYFSIIPVEQGVSCQYKTDDLKNANTIKITIPVLDSKNQLIPYTRDRLISKINSLFIGTDASGSIVSIINDNNAEYTKFRITISKEYSGKDYRIVFYDPYSFVRCFVGAKTVHNTTWDATIGWILGYRGSTEYNLSSSIYDSSSGPAIKQVTSDTGVSTNLFNYSYLN